MFVSSCIFTFSDSKLDLHRTLMIDRICIKGCKHDSWIPKLHGSVAHQICHSRSETSRALDNIFIALSSPPGIKSFTVEINFVHQHLSFLAFNLKSVSLQQPGIYSTTYVFQQGGRFSSRGSHPSQTHPWTWRTDTSNRQHAAQGNLVNASHPGCERNVAVEAEKSDPGRDDSCDYCSVVTFILKGERFATTIFDASSHTLKLTARPYKIGRKWNIKIDFQTTMHLQIRRTKKRHTKQKVCSQRYSLNYSLKMNSICLHTTYTIFSIDWLLGMLPNLFWFLICRLWPMTLDRIWCVPASAAFVNTWVCIFPLGPSLLLVKRKTLCDTLPFSPSKCCTVCFLVAILNHFSISWLVLTDQSNVYLLYVTWQHVFT